VTRIVGVDGYARGWVAVELDGSIEPTSAGRGSRRSAVSRRRGRFRAAWLAPTLASLLDGVPDRASIGVDIPMGLLEAGWRHADRAAAVRLGARRASVFAVAPRAAWAATSHAEANRLCRDLAGGGFSAQAWGLRRKVLEADAYRDAAAHELVEVHPELVFATLAGAPLPYPKKSWAGQQLRTSLLAAVGVSLPADLGAAGAAGPDDILDAAAVAWCAYRISRGIAGQVPDPPDQYDHRGRPILIRY
jgi:predicted RNase H-like nuclease